MTVQFFKIALYYAVHKYVRLKNIWNKKRLLNITSDNKVLFIHIPKNAGTAISKLLNISLSHITAQEVSKALGPEKFGEYFSFCILRDPIERFISLYNYAIMPVSIHHDNTSLVAWPKSIHLDHFKLKNKDINECVRLLEKGALAHDASWNLWKPQTTWIYDEDKNILVDHIATQDDLGSLVKLLAQRTEFSGELNWINKSTGNSSQQRRLLNKESLEILNKYYKSDFELYNSRDKF